MMLTFEICPEMHALAKMAEMAINHQFKSPAAGDFSPLSPFSPLHAFLDISVTFK